MDRHLEAQRRRSRVATLVDTGLATIQFSAPLAGLFIGVGRVRTGALGLGEMLGAVTLLSALVAPVAGFAQTALRIALVRTFAARMLDVFETPREGIARWGIWDECSDPLGLGRPRFALRFEPGQPSVLRLCVSLADRSHEGDHTLAGTLEAVLISQNPELAERVASNRLVLEVTLAGEGREPHWADPYDEADRPSR